VSFTDAKGKKGLAVKAKAGLSPGLFVRWLAVIRLHLIAGAEAAAVSAMASGMPVPSS